MKKIYFLLFFSSIITFGQIKVGLDINGEATNDYSGTSVSLSADGTVLAIGAYGNDGNGSDSGHVRIYKNISGVWTQVGSDINGEAANDYSGISISLSADGTILGIGAYGNDGNGTNSGHVRIYKNISGVWTQVGSDINGEAANDYSGISISLSADGTILGIGAYGNDGNGTNSGHVRIYKNISGVWTQVGSDINGETTNDYSGTSVSLSADGTILGIGAYGNDGNGTNSGHVRIYKNISGVWTQVGSDINGEAANDYSGTSVSLSADGTAVAIGAYGNDGNGTESGHVRIYKNISDVWTQVGSDINGEAPNDSSGYSVSLSADGTVVIIGAIHNNGNGANSGHVRIYKNISGVWTQVGSDINGEAANDYSGYSVSLSANGAVIAIGSPENDENGNNSGHVRVYDLSALLSSDEFILKNFNIYPNPANENVSIDLNENLELEKVNIYNLSGQLIKSERNQNINVCNFANGNYIFEVITDKGKAAKTVLIK